jgi:hypothetical protein
MSNTTAAIRSTSFVVAECNDAGQVVHLVSEARPATFAAADTALAFASLGRTSAWELDANCGVQASVAPVDNRFNGTVAARLDQAVGYTHKPFGWVLASSVKDGDLISDADLSALYVVAGCSWESGAMTVHMVAEGKTWSERYTSAFSGSVMVARKR